jgi:hypothetical protein
MRGQNKAVPFMVGRKQRKKGTGFPIFPQEHIPNELFPPTGLHLLKFQPPSNNATSRSQDLTHKPLRDIQISIITVFWGQVV